MSAMGSFVIAGVLLVTSTFYVGPKVMSMGLMKENADKIDNSLVNGLSYAGGGFMMIILVLFAGFFWLATIGRRFFPTTADNIIIKVPYYSEIVLAQENYTNLYRLSLMVKSGVRMEEALKTAWESCRRGALKDDFERAMKALKVGQKWATGMTILHPTDRAALMLAADRDQIATNLNNIAAQYNSLYRQRISQFTPTMQVLSAFAMSLSGFVLFGQTVMPMLQLSANMMNN
jgi:general secretion pathway protein F